MEDHEAVGAEAARDVFPGEDWQAAPPEAVGLDAKKLDAAMRHVAEIAGPQGGRESLVVRDGRLVWRGPDIDRKHTVWSCSKSFAGMAMGLLLDDGKCTLDTVAADVLPSLREHYPTVTLREFANFTSGYRGRGSGDTTAIFEPAPPLYAPGAMFHYSQSTDQLTNVLTRIAGEPLRDLFRRRVADPIGLDPAGWSWGDWGRVDGLVVCGGSGSFERGISMTARQMARVSWMLVNGGRWGQRQVLSRAFVEAATSPQVAGDVPPYDPDGWYVKLPGSYGLGFWVNGRGPSGEPRWPQAPARTSVIQGNNNNFCFIIPEWRMVLIRMGTDARINNDRYDEVFARMREAFVDGTA